MKNSSLVLLQMMTILPGYAMPNHSCDLLKVAEARLAEVFPSFDPKGMKPKISENDQIWELTYVLPDTMIGGAPIVTIDKKTCTVVRIIRTQ